MKARPVDLSQLGATLESDSPSYDLSQLGAMPESDATSQILQQVQQTQSQPTLDYASNLALSNQLIDPMSGINVLLSKFNPRQVVTPLLKAGGKVAMMSQPELMSSPGMMQGIVNALGRIGTGAAGMTTQELDNVKTPQDLLNKFTGNLGYNALFETIPLGVRAIGGIAELMNPQKFTDMQINKLQDDLSQAKNAEDKLYNPVMENYGKENLSDMNGFMEQYNKFSDLLPTRTIDMIKNLLKNPNIENAHKTQSQMFSDYKTRAKNYSPDAVTLNQMYALEQTRDALRNNMIDTLASKDQNAAKDYIDATNIHREFVTPHYATPQLANLSEGIKESVTPSNYTKILSDAVDKMKADAVRRGQTPNINPIFSKSLGDVNYRISRGNFVQNALPIAIGALGGVGGEMIHPGLAGALGGAASLGAGASFLEPRMIAMAQEPYVRQHLSNFLQPLYYGTLRGFTANQANQ